MGASVLQNSTGKSKYAASTSNWWKGDFPTIIPPHGTPWTQVVSIHRQSVMMLLMRKNSVVVLVCLFACWGCERGPANLRQLPLVQSRFAEGETWMRFSPMQRDGFVRGYIVAYRDAAHHGCSFGKGPDYSACMDEMPQFGKPAESYVSSMTEFYTRYPQDRTLPLTFLLDFLSDQHSAGLGDIDRWCDELSRGLHPKPPRAVPPPLPNLPRLQLPPPPPPQSYAVP